MSVGSLRGADAERLQEKFQSKVRPILLRECNDGLHAFCERVPTGTSDRNSEPESLRYFTASYKSARLKVSHE